MYKENEGIKARWAYATFNASLTSHLMLFYLYIYNLCTNEERCLIMLLMLLLKNEIQYCT